MIDISNQPDPDKKPSRMKRAAKFMFDVPTWIGASNWTGVFGWIKQLISEIFAGAMRVSKTQEHESFQEAMERLHVSEKDLQQQRMLYLKSSWFFLILSILASLYIAYIWHGSLFFSKVVGILVILICLLQAVRFSFWSFQIKQRRLGCTLKQWFSWLLRGHV